MDRNKRPGRAGLVRCDYDGNAAQVIDLLIDDMAEAGAVYEKRAGAEKPVEFARRATASCDVVVLGMDAADPRFAGVLDGLDGECTVYAVCACIDCAAEEALGCLATLEEACEQRGLTWRGGLAVEDAQTVAAFEHSPRLGFWRRPVSEGLDRLLLALRCGEDAGRFAVRQGPFRRAFAVLLQKARKTGA